MTQAEPIPAHHDPDANLILAMAAGDSSALSDIMDLHLSSLKSLAWHMLGDDAAAEDVAQEVFLKAWIQARKWEPGRAKFITWMKRVATNACLDRLRKKKEILSDTLPERADGAISADAAMIETDTAQAVRAAIDTLPERQRAALTLCHFQDMSQSDAADILEITVSAYESLLARARRSLKAALTPDKDTLMTGFAPRGDI